LQYLFYFFLLLLHSYHIAPTLESAILPEDWDLTDYLNIDFLPNGIITFVLLMFSVVSFILNIRFALQLRRKNFGLYLSRGYFAVSSQKEDVVGKLRYIKLTLDTYNRLLERNLNLKIKDTMRIYSLIMSASAEQRIKIRESIGKALEKDKLELARQLAEISRLPDEEDF